LELKLKLLHSKKSEFKLKSKPHKNWNCLHY